MKHEQKRSPEQEQRWIEKKQLNFRQSKKLAEIFFDFYRHQDGRLDPETNRVLFDSLCLPEGMPAINSAKAERDAWDQRTKEIENQTDTWIGLLQDGSVEIIYEHTRFDKGYIRPTINIDDLPDTISQMTCRIQSDQEEAKTDPFASHLRKVTSPGRKILERSKEKVTLHPNETVTREKWSEKYDDQGVVKVTKKNKKKFRSTDEEIAGDLIQLHFNFYNLRPMLNRALEYGEADPTSVYFTKEIRKKILSFALAEIQLNSPSPNKRLHVSGTTEYKNRTVSGALEFTHFETNISDPGNISVTHTTLVIPIENSSLSQRISIHGPIHMNEGLHKVMRMSSEVYKAVSNWEKESRRSMGDDNFEALLETEIESALNDLRTNKGNVSGQTRRLNIQPQTQRYQYSLTKKVHAGDINNPGPDEIYIDKNGNPEDPSVDELATLISLIW